LNPAALGNLPPSAVSNWFISSSWADIHLFNVCTELDPAALGKPTLLLCL
jgi:hypothetical protein